MARNYDIAEFQETDALDPTATRKLNHNFHSILTLVNDIQVGGIDTGAIAAYVLDVIDDEIDSLEDEVGNHETRIEALEEGSGGSVTGVKGNLESTYRVGEVNLTIDNIEIPMNWLEILTEWDHVINPTQGEQNG